MYDCAWVDKRLQQQQLLSINHYWFGTSSRLLRIYYCKLFIKMQFFYNLKIFLGKKIHHRTPVSSIIVHSLRSWQFLATFIFLFKIMHPECLQSVTKLIVVISNLKLGFSGTLRLFSTKFSDILYEFARHFSAFYKIFYK
jgi:hypothetical protein